ncbi:hypothetical protein BH11MYX4_BH11MYX4_41990 [soil metagenome]
MKKQTMSTGLNITDRIRIRSSSRRVIGEPVDLMAERRVLAAEAQHELAARLVARDKMLAADAPKATPAAPAPAADDTEEPQSPDEQKKLRAIFSILGVPFGDAAAAKAAFDKLMGPVADEMAKLTSRQRSKVIASQINPAAFRRALRS